MEDYEEDIVKLSPPVLRRLRLLQELDDKIDFARSTIQLRIVMAFISGKDSYTPSELVNVIDERRKAIIDALRKLESKGIVEREKDSYSFRLSEKGREYTKRLLALLGITKEQLTTRFSENGPLPRQIVLASMNEALYIHRAIVALANQRTGKLSLKELASVMGLSRDRAKSYLDLYSRPPYRVFRRITHPTRGTYYKLEKYGYTIYYRTIEYSKAKRSRLFRLALKIRTMVSLGPIPNREILLTATTVASILLIIATSFLGGYWSSAIVSIPLFLLLFFLGLTY
jgi:DNA-binding MarR family transcriptional regulator